MKAAEQDYTVYFGSQGFGEFHDNTFIVACPPENYVVANGTPAVCLQEHDNPPCLPVGTVCDATTGKPFVHAHLNSSSLQITALFGAIICGIVFALFINRWARQYRAMNWEPVPPDEEETEFFCNEKLNRHNAGMGFRECAD